MCEELHWVCYYFAGVPILWQSKLQTEAALSTMGAEIIALVACCRELFPIIDMVTSLTSSVHLPIGETTMNLSIHEDNSGALVLAKTLPPHITPRSKYYASKTIWFWEEVHKCGIKLLKINTVKQMGDIFTKGLVQVTFEYRHKKMICWWSMGTGSWGALSYPYILCILFCSLHCHENSSTECGRECQARLVRPLLRSYCGLQYSTIVLY